MPHEPIPEAQPEPTALSIAQPAVSAVTPISPKEVAVASGPQREMIPPLANYYPRRAISRRLTGRTVVRVHVAANGKVQDVQVVSSTPPGVFEAAAQKAARKIRYGERPAAAPAVWVEETLEWKLSR